MAYFIRESYLVLMQSCLILLSFNSKCSAQQVTSWNWTHPVSKTIMNGNGTGVTVDYTKFKRSPFYYESTATIFRKDSSATKLECGILCMEHPNCLTWVFFNTHWICYLFDFRFQAHPLKAKLYGKTINIIDIYEFEVIITHAELICRSRLILRLAPPRRFQKKIGFHSNF